jgi:hypothetical protein
MLHMHACVWQAQVVLDWVISMAQAYVWVCKDTFDDEGYQSVS